MASAVIAIEPIALTVASLQSNWGLSTYTETPETSHSFVLPFIRASSESEDDHEDETKKVKVAGPASSSPGPCLSEGIVDSLRSDQIPLMLTKAEQSRYQRLRMAELRRVASLYFLERLTQHEIVKKTGLSLKEVSEHMARVREIGAAR
jgi:hypothetical protein